MPGTFEPITGTIGPSGQSEGEPPSLFLFAILGVPINGLKVPISGLKVVGIPLIGFYRLFL